jgi:hypothetical protein
MRFDQRQEKQKSGLAGLISFQEGRYGKRSHASDFIKPNLDVEDLDGDHGFVGRNNDRVV